MNDPDLRGALHGGRAARLMELLGLSEDELCTVLDADPLTLLSGQLEHRPELPILLSLLDEASERAAPSMLRSWVRTSGPAGRPIDALLRRDFAAFEDALTALAERGFVLRGGAVAEAPPASPVGGHPFVHTLRVRYAECDAQGVLFNAHYLAYVDHTITELWRAAFGAYQAMLDRDLDIVVAAATLRFRGAARFDDEVRIEARIAALGTTSIQTAYRFLRGDELLLEAELRHVFITAGTGIKTAIPDWARTRLAPWVTGESARAPRVARDSGRAR